MKKLILVFAIVFSFIGNSKAWYIEHCNGHFMTYYVMVCTEHGYKWEMYTFYEECGTQQFTNICEIVLPNDGTPNEPVKEATEELKAMLPLEIQTAVEYNEIGFKKYVMNEINPKLKSTLATSELGHNMISDLQVTPNPIQDRQIKFSYQASNQQLIKIQLLDSKTGIELKGGELLTKGQCHRTTGNIQLTSEMQGEIILKVTSDNTSITKRVVL